MRKATTICVIALLVSLSVSDASAFEGYAEDNALFSISYVITDAPSGGTLTEVRFTNRSSVPLKVGEIELRYTCKDGSLDNGFYGFVNGGAYIAPGRSETAKSVHFSPCTGRGGVRHVGLGERLSVSQPEIGSNEFECGGKRKFYTVDLIGGGKVFVLRSSDNITAKLSVKEAADSMQPAKEESPPAEQAEESATETEEPNTDCFSMFDQDKCNIKKTK